MDIRFIYTLEVYNKQSRQQYLLQTASKQFKLTGLTKMSDLMIQQSNDELVVDSRLIAERLGVEHRALRQTVHKYLAELQGFGVVTFEMSKLETGTTGRPERFCYLNENQAIFVMTLSRNTAQVVQCKVELVNAFARAKQLLVASPKKEALPSRVLALETATAIDQIQDKLGKSNPRLAQLLCDHAINDVLELKQLPSAPEFPEDKWHSIVNIAESMGIKTNASTRVKLGQFVAKFDLERVKEERLCNGQMAKIWCYRDDEATRAVVKQFNNQMEN